MKMPKRLIAGLGVLMLVGAWIGIRLYGYTSAVDNFRILFMWATLVPLCAIGVVLGWRTFVELETPDGPSADVHFELPPPFVGTDMFNGTRHSNSRIVEQT